jgi:hypothetical protein
MTMSWLRDDWQLAKSCEYRLRIDVNPEDEDGRLFWYKYRITVTYPDSGVPSKSTHNVIGILAGNNLHQMIGFITQNIHRWIHEWQLKEARSTTPSTNGNGHVSKPPPKPKTIPKVTVIRNAEDWVEEDPLVFFNPPKQKEINSHFDAGHVYVDVVIIVSENGVRREVCKIRLKRGDLESLAPEWDGPVGRCRKLRLLNLSGDERLSKC